MTDLLVGREFGLSPAEVDAMPDWLFARAELWLDVVAQVRRERLES